MADPWVENVQNWLNNTYTGVPGWEPVTVTGRPAWSTMYALTRALQHELGITALSNTFGAGTLSALQALGPIGPATAHVNIANINNIIIAALYCKGYNAGNGLLPGTYGLPVVSAVQQIRGDIGISTSDATVTPKIFKALLTMDPYKRLAGGSQELRKAQQWLNATYNHRASYNFIPTDGLGSRGALQALIYAIQYEGGMSDSVANGNFGPGTQTIVQTQASLDVGAADGAKNYVKLFTTAMLLNDQDVAFSGQYGAGLSALVTAFQEFAQLTVDGKATFQTWASLLSSRGDPSRPGRAADMATPLTSSSAAGLYASGYRIVGRYLVTAGSNPNWKVLQPGELQAIFAAGLTVFPIYQMTGDTLGYFTQTRGFVDGQAAGAAASAFGFPSNVTIYFAVDYDTQDAEITSHILPYFKGVIQGLRSTPGKVYRVGVYGTRNVCTRVSRTYSLQHSFVSDMSTGYSGNMGFPLPFNWTFDQIATVSVAYPGGSIEIDRNVWRTSDPEFHDPGVDSLVVVNEPNKDFFDWVAEIEALATTYHANHPDQESARELTLQYLRGANDDYRGAPWDLIAGGDNDDWFDHVRAWLDATGRFATVIVTDPWTGQEIKVDHMAYAMQSMLTNDPAVRPSPSRSDIGGWGGDLLTILRDYVKNDRGYLSGHAYASALIGSTSIPSSFSQDDLLADVDAYNFGLALRADENLSLLTLFARAYGSGGAGPSLTRRRFTDFYANRFGSSSEVDASGFEVFRFTGDVNLTAARAGAMRDVLLGTVSDDTIRSVVDGFQEVLDLRRSLEP